METSCRPKDTFPTTDKSKYTRTGCGSADNLYLQAKLFQFGWGINLGPLKNTGCGLVEVNQQNFGRALDSFAQGHRHTLTHAHMHKIRRHQGVAFVPRLQRSAVPKEAHLLLIQ